MDKQEEKNLKFIEKARKVWGLKYNYIKTKYVDYRTPVIIMYEGIEYKQTPSKHLAGKKCELSDNKLSKDEFVRRCNIQWDNRFDYSNTNYINSYTDIEFYDKKLDIVINQKAYSHMSGNKYSINKDNFIILSNRIYDYKYDYSRVEYDKLTDDIILKCFEHGLFKVNGYNHLNNRFGSCKECDEYNIIKFIDKYLDDNLISYEKEYYFDNLALPFSYYFPKKRKVIDIFIEKNDKSLKNNKIKNEYCEDNFIDLIEIREYDIFRIENILNNIFIN